MTRLIRPITQIGCVAAQHCTTSSAQRACQQRATRPPSSSSGTASFNTTGLRSPSHRTQHSSNRLTPPEQHSTSYLFPLATATIIRPSHAPPSPAHSRQSPSPLPGPQIPRHTLAPPGHARVSVLSLASAARACVTCPGCFREVLSASDVSYATLTPSYIARKYSILLLLVSRCLAFLVALALS
ncbi:hypothetical protein EDB80DRAFT_112173 [Ilyonectria destructans]|nr:hypothetical protein EDB80DRAFT_112173 [Ilyonectria destructans]